MTEPDYQTRNRERAVAMMTAARADDVDTVNQIGQEAATAGEFSLLLWSLIGLWDATLITLSKCTGRPADDWLREIAMGVAASEEDD